MSVICSQITPIEILLFTSSRSPISPWPPKSFRRDSSTVNFSWDFLHSNDRYVYRPPLVRSVFPFVPVPNSDRVRVTHTFVVFPVSPTSHSHFPLCPRSSNFWCTQCDSWSLQLDSYSPHNLPTVVRHYTTINTKLSWPTNKDWQTLNLPLVPLPYSCSSVDFPRPSSNLLSTVKPRPPHHQTSSSSSVYYDPLLR